jgi:hypothetical protein
VYKPQEFELLQTIAALAVEAVPHSPSTTVLTQPQRSGRVAAALQRHVTQGGFELANSQAISRRRHKVLHGRRGRRAAVHRSGESAADGRGQHDKGAGLPCGLARSDAVDVAAPATKRRGAAGWRAHFLPSALAHIGQSASRVVVWSGLGSRTGFGVESSRATESPCCQE